MARVLPKLTDALSVSMIFHKIQAGLIVHGIENTYCPGPERESGASSHRVLAIQAWFEPCLEDIQKTTGASLEPTGSQGPKGFVSNPGLREISV